MTGAASLRELLARVEAAEGPDRDIDEAITRTFGYVSRTGIPVCVVAGIGAFTSDLGTAMRLAEGFLPPIKAFSPGSPPSSGWKINLYRGMTPTGEPYAQWECCIRPHAGAERWHRAPTAALAVLCAFLSALIAQADINPDRAGTGSGTTAGEAGSDDGRTGP